MTGCSRVPAGQERGVERPDAAGQLLEVPDPGRRRHHHAGAGPPAPASRGRGPPPWPRCRGRSPPAPRRGRPGPGCTRPGATNTSRTASCCPWSISNGWTRSTTEPALSTAIPTCTSRSGSPHSTTFGDTIPALERKDSSTRRWTVSGKQGHVVVAEEVVVGAVDHGPHLVGDRPVALGGLEAADVGGRQHRRHPGGQILGAGVVEDQHRQLRIVLRSERGQRLLEPRTGIVGDDDGDHRRGQCFHQAQRLPAADRPGGNPPVNRLSHGIPPDPARSACKCIPTRIHLYSIRSRHRTGSGPGGHRRPARPP